MCFEKHIDRAETKTRCSGDRRRVRTPQGRDSATDPYRARLPRARTIPASAYWGVHTARALRELPDQRHAGLGATARWSPALGAVKLAAVRANHELGLLDDRRARRHRARRAGGPRRGRSTTSSSSTCIQGGAGTSTNMNANEVIANRALEILGLPAASYDEIHPLDHVNRCQWTNDVYPTAVRLALVGAIDGLVDAVRRSPRRSRPRRAEFRAVRRSGAPSSRTPYR